MPWPDNHKVRRGRFTDSVAPWGQWTAKILGLPVVTSIPTLAVNRSVMRFGLAHGVRPKSVGRVLNKLRHMTRAWRVQRRLRRVHGVDGPGVMDSLTGHSGLNIVYTSRHFQPCAETFDDRFLFIGPMTSRAEAASAFPWDRLESSRSEASGRAPAIVYISLGTLFNADPAFYRACFEAFAGADLTVILSIGTNVPLDRIGAVPKNFIVAPQVPQLAVLQRASAFVTHGGMNSVSESLFYSVPMTVVPQMGEQAIIGRRVAQLGAGICLTKEEATAPGSGTRCSACSPTTASASRPTPFAAPSSTPAARRAQPKRFARSRDDESIKYSDDLL